MTGVLKIRTTKEFGESTVSKILGSRRKCQLPQVQVRGRLFPALPEFIRLPCVYAALALAIRSAAGAACSALDLSPDWVSWIYRALTFLVVELPLRSGHQHSRSASSPASAEPARTVFWSKAPIIWKLCQRLNIVVFDKTGTLTQGVFEVSGIHHNEMDKCANWWSMLHLAECASSHPISKSLAEGLR